MKIIGHIGRDDIAVVYLAECGSGKLVEFAESVQPPIPRENKWVLIVSSLFGCPVGCRMCDAGGFYQGKLTAEEIFAQIDYMVKRRYPDSNIPVKKFKVQFARMGEPALNPEVLKVLQQLPHRYDAPGLLPTLSTVAPKGADSFFKSLMELKKKIYPRGFQLQFSLHSTDEESRNNLIPVKKWDLNEIAGYGGEFFDEGGLKITLNFALAEGSPLDVYIIERFFTPRKFLIKFTPVNPTMRAHSGGLRSRIAADIDNYDFIDSLRALGYDVILSIGELEENRIGSNCGQHISNYLRAGKKLPAGYDYIIEGKLSYDEESMIETEA